MMGPESNNSVSAEWEYADLRVTSRSIMAIKDGQPLIVLPLNQVRRISVESGLQSERPVLQRLFGAVLLIVGLYPIGTFLVQPAVFGLKSLMIVGFIPFGIWGIWTSFAAGNLLRVESSSGTRKLPLTRDVERQKLKELLTPALEEFGIEYIET